VLHGPSDSERLSRLGSASAERGTDRDLGGYAKTQGCVTDVTTAFSGVVEVSEKLNGSWRAWVSQRGKAWVVPARRPESVMDGLPLVDMAEFDLYGWPAVRM